MSEGSRFYLKVGLNLPLLEALNFFRNFFWALLKKSSTNGALINGALGSGPSRLTFGPAILNSLKTLKGIKLTSLHNSLFIIRFQFSCFCGHCMLFWLFC
jgi:hypothetical protein